MFIHEYQAKRLLKEHGIPAPPGDVATTVDEALDVARRLDCERWAIKAQVYAGGRGAGYFRGQDPAKGGVRIVATLDELRRDAHEMLGRVLVTDQTGAGGREVERVYIESGCDVARELYLAMLIDPGSGQITLVASARGGRDIESVASDSPDAIARLPIDILKGPPPQRVRELARGLSLDEAQTDAVCDIIASMFRMFTSLDLSLIEINPLAVTARGEVLALDTVLSFDDNALFRHPEIRALRDERELPVGQLQASVHGFNYVKLEGDISCMASGAGLALATLDAIKHAGGEPANFLDVPPVVHSSVVKDAFRLLLSDAGVKAVLVNVFGGGIMRCDTIADGLLMALHEEPTDVPLVVRLAGVNAELGVARLKGANQRIRFAGDLTEATDIAVESARESALAHRKSWWRRASALIVSQRDLSHGDTR